MLTTLKNAFKIKEIRKKLLFTFLMLVVIRIGCQLPVPGVNIIDHYSAFNDCDPEAGRNAERWGRGA